jgi:dTDP-L-rhamnose 4-epimerase
VRVLVTGGGGFIGSHVVAALIDAGHQVRVLDRAPARLHPGAQVQRADLAEPGVAEAAVEGVEAVCHHAARVGLGVDFTDAPSYVRDNDLATAHLLAALGPEGRCRRLVLASSMVVYGEGRYRCLVDGIVRPKARRSADLHSGRFEPPCPTCGAPLEWAPVPEDARLDPRSVYAASKLAQENLCALWARQAGATVVALRYHNVYGPGLPLDTPYAGVAALFRSALRRGEPPRVYEDGRQTRDFVHVSDVARANLLALTAPLEEGESRPANICSGRPRTIAQVAGALADAFGPDAPRPVLTGEFRLGDVRHIVAAPDRARSWLAFSARVQLEEGIADVAADAPGEPGSGCLGGAAS